MAMGTRLLLDVDETSTMDVSTSIFVACILTNDLLYDLVLWFCDPFTLLRFARTCRAAHTAVQSHIARAYNINTHLAHFFSNPLAFRSLQARTGALISGSNALQFLARTHYPDADLDIYCAYPDRAQICEWLVRNEDYAFHPQMRQDPSLDVALNQARVPDAAPPLSTYNSFKAVSGVYTFTKRITTANGMATRYKVQVIVAYRCPIEPIFDFHSSAFQSTCAARFVVLTRPP